MPEMITTLNDAELDAVTGGFIWAKNVNFGNATGGYNIGNLNFAVVNAGAQNNSADGVISQS